MARTTMSKMRTLPRRRGMIPRMRTLPRRRGMVPRRRTLPRTIFRRRSR